MSQTEPLDSPPRSMSNLASLPSEWAPHVVPQAYERYTSSDHELWSDLVADIGRTLDRHSASIHPAYLAGFQSLIRPWTGIPRLPELDASLSAFGWRTVSVDGYIPAEVYAGMLTHGIFPVSRNLRTRNHIGFSPVPDMAHDLFGHVPMLTSDEHRRFIRRLSRAMSLAKASQNDVELYEANRAMAEIRCQPAYSAPALRAAEERVQRVQALLARDPSPLTQLGRMYLWSTEFGLLGTPDKFQVYGAGLLSAMSELELVVSRKAVVVPFTAAVFAEDIEFSDPQRRYFVAESFDALHEILTAYEERARMTAATVSLPRVLEPEVMDTALDAEEYRTIDNHEVNRLFVESVLALAPQSGRARVLDLGTGPGDIAVVLAQSAPDLTVVAVDLAEHMLAIAREQVAKAALGARVEVARRDAKATGYADASFDMVVSNSLVHHIPEPIAMFAEIARVVRPGGAIFIKDLLRPRTNAELDALVALHAGNDSDYQRELFRNSLHAALRVEEVESMCRDAGLLGVEVRQVSDRHWTMSRGAAREHTKGTSS